MIHTSVICSSCWHPHQPRSYGMIWTVCRWIITLNQQTTKHSRGKNDYVSLAKKWLHLTWLNQGWDKISFRDGWDKILSGAKNRRITDGPVHLPPSCYLHHLARWRWRRLWCHLARQTAPHAASSHGSAAVQAYTGHGSVACFPGLEFMLPPRSFAAAATYKITTFGVICKRLHACRRFETLLLGASVHNSAGSVISYAAFGWHEGVSTSIDLSAYPVDFDVNTI